MQERVKVLLNQGLSIRKVALALARPRRRPSHCNRQIRTVRR